MADPDGKIADDINIEQREDLEINIQNLKINKKIFQN